MYREILKTLAKLDGMVMVIAVAGGSEGHKGISINEIHEPCDFCVMLWEF